MQSGGLDPYTPAEQYYAADQEAAIKAKTRAYSSVCVSTPLLRVLADCRLDIRARPEQCGREPSPGHTPRQPR